MLKKLLSIVCVVCVCLSLTSVTLADSGAERVEIPEIEFICTDATKDLTYECDGGREESGNSERVYGWSTCVNSQNVNVHHYTTARYETILGSPRGEAGTNWGYDQVWAYSGWLQGNVTISLKARVYYGC